MLHGIGGSSIEQAKESISYDEALAWMAYRQKHGSLNTGIRLEWGFALLATLIANANGGKAEMYDFMPHVEEKVADVGDVLKIFEGVR